MKKVEKVMMQRYHVSENIFEGKVPETVYASLEH